MPKITDDMASQAIAGTNYQFTGQRIDTLGSNEWTLGVVIMDVSGSTSRFRPEMERVLKAIYRACLKNPRADCMMLRVVKFDTQIDEVHGFKPLADCNESDYDGCLGLGGGLTALYDACFTGVQSALQYGKALTAKDYDANAAIFVVTDGCEYPPNASTATPSMVKTALEDAVVSESLESITSVLIGLNAGGSLDAQLAKVKDACGFMQYESVDNVDENSLARIAEFISRSFSSQSQMLGTGGPSQSLSF